MEVGQGNGVAAVWGRARQVGRGRDGQGRAGKYKCSVPIAAHHKSHIYNGTKGEGRGEEASRTCMRRQL